MACKCLLKFVKVSENNLSKDFVNDAAINDFWRYFVEEKNEMKIIINILKNEAVIESKTLKNKVN